MKNKKDFAHLRAENLKRTRQALKQSVSPDMPITQAISGIDELDRACNLLVKRLREWYGWYYPELGRDVLNNEQFAALVASRSREEFMNERNETETIGADLQEEDVAEMQLLAQHITALYKLRKVQEQYLARVMKSYCPNLAELAGVTIGARLLELAKGLKHLALLPASTIQLLGAEKALFRHLTSGAKSPKHGVIVNHPFVQQAGKRDKGKAARMLADKLSLCARLDYFKGEFKAPEYRKELERKLAP